MIKWLTVALLLIVCNGVGAQTPTPADVHLKLSLAENKTVYRIGEPIVVVMEFTADRDGYLIEFLPDGNQPGSDTVVISPDTGVIRWIDDIANNVPRHVFSTEKLSSSPKRLEISLNDRLRFDSPGRYTVNVTTRRVSLAGSKGPFTLQTNPVSFEVQSMSDEDESKEIKRLSALLAVAGDWQSEDKIAKQLFYLTGDPSTREKVRRFLHPEDRKGNYHTHLWFGLFIARNRALVLKLLESGMRDPN
ncbi:MAG TPA: hypothetical protein VJS17_04845, partial [Pyrinomonadaceae bacterium]|nr:hypothetical protein [Pyrinomonadaceae bacterium]